MAQESIQELALGNQLATEALDAHELLWQSHLSGQIAQLTPGQSAKDQPARKRNWHDPSGKHQALLDAQALRQANNREFVTQIEHDYAVGPHLEWGIAGTAVVGKALVKGWILGKAGEYVGPAGRMIGYGSGIGIGLVSGVYTAYETADLLENSAKAGAYESRLRQNMGGTLSDPGGGLDPFSQMYNLERGFPSVRNLVDWSKEAIDSARGKEVVDADEVFTQKALAHSNLDTEAYIAWAKQESLPSTQKAWRHHLGFAAMGLAGGLFTARKLHLGWQGNLVAGTAGAAFGLGLSYLGVKAKEETELAGLYKARLMSHPDDRPRP